MDSEQVTQEPPSVLVVDDHPPLRELIETVLNDAGYQVMTAASADEALRIVEKTSVDLLLTDIGMPGLSADDLVQRFQGLSKNPRVVIISGSDPRELKAHAGAHFLRKPFSSKALLAVVVQALEGR